jgi:hypothetical protein
MHIRCAIFAFIVWAGLFSGAALAMNELDVCARSCPADVGHGADAPSLCEDARSLIFDDELLFETTTISGFDRIPESFVIPDTTTPMPAMQNSDARPQPERCPEPHRC